MKPESTFQKIADVLHGIDLTESAETSDGWWPTTEGARFGARKLREIEMIVRAADLRFTCALDALRNLRDEQNGPPLERRQAQWYAAMVEAAEVLDRSNA